MPSSIISPFPVFNDLDGTPLENGYIYIGQSNLNPETAPVNVYWDAARTIPAPQPIRTIGGFPSRNGSPSNVYVEADTYSITVRNSRRVFVYNAFDQTGLEGTVYSISTQLITASAGQTIFSLTTFQYLPATKTLEVYKNGLRLNLGIDYTETNSSTVTLTSPANSGDKLLFQGGSVASNNIVPGTSVSFIQAGTGAVTRNMQDKVRESVSVKDFGAVGDGVTDDTAAIQAAIDSLPNGGTVQLPSGSYKVSSQIQIQKPISLIGSLGNTFLLSNMTTGAVLSLNTSSAWSFDTGPTISGIVFKSSVVRSSGEFIKSNAVYYVTVKDCQFLNGVTGILHTGIATNVFYVSNCIFANNTGKNIIIDSVTTGGPAAQGSTDITLKNLTIKGQSSVLQSLAGISISSCGSGVISNVSTLHCGNGLELIPNGTSSRIQALFVSDSYFDSGNKYGIFISGGFVNLVKFSQVWACSNTQGGIIVSGTVTAPVQQIDFVSVQACGNTSASGGSGNGLYIEQHATNINVFGCSFGGNTANGIAVASGITDFKVTNSTCGDTGEFAGNSQWGIFIASGASNSYVVSGNNLFGNTTGALFDGGTGTNKTVYPNIGVGTAITTNSVPATDWGIDCAKQGAVLIANGTPYQLAVGSGLVLLHSNSTGDLGMFLAFAGTVTKVSGAATMVSGAAGANQIGLAYNGGAGKYEISNGYVAAQQINISTLKTRLAS